MTISVMSFVNYLLKQVILLTLQPGSRDQLMVSMTHRVVGGILLIKLCANMVWYQLVQTVVATSYTAI